MIMGGKTLKKRKTVANKKTANPVYNEAFVFTLLPSYLDRVSFMLSVFTVTRLGGSKKLIGRAVVGPYMYSTDQGLSHWNDMINSPRNPVAQWHTLIWKKRFHKIKEIYFRNTNKPAEPQLQTSELSEDSRILNQSGSVKISIMPSKITEKKPDPYGQRSERDKNMKKNQMLKVNLHDFSVCNTNRNIGQYRNIYIILSLVFTYRAATNASVKIHISQWKRHANIRTSSRIA